MPFSTWLPFFIATVAISLSPGPGALAAMGVGLNYGFRRGQVVAFGLALGVWTQLAVVSLGLGALLASSEAAFAVVKWAGAAYLVWLGVQQWRSPANPLVATTAQEGSVAGVAESVRTADAPSPGRETGPAFSLPRQLLLRGWGVNALNPKGTVFLLAVMPQFLDTALPLLPQYLVIGATFGLVECAVMSGYVALAARVLRLLRSPQHIRWMNRSFGGLFVLAGLALASFRRSGPAL